MAGGTFCVKNNCLTMNQVYRDILTYNNWLKSANYISLRFNVNVGRTDTDIVDKSQ